MSQSFDASRPTGPKNFLGLGNVKRFSDHTLDFRKADSVVAQDGRRLLSMSSERSTIFLIDWNLKAGTIASPEYRQILL